MLPFAKIYCISLYWLSVIFTIAYMEHMMHIDQPPALLISFLNQARAWFLKIDPVRIVSMRACMRVCVCVCVCVCLRPRLVITSGVMWHDIDLI